MTIDWLKIKSEYINTNISYRKLAEKFNVSFNTLKGKAIKEKWKDCKDKQHNKIITLTQQKTAVVVSNYEANRIKRLTDISDKLVSKIEKATEQLENYIVSKKVKVKTSIIGNMKNGGHNTETTTETEQLEIVDGIVDKLGIKQLASALKDLKDIISGSNDFGDDVTIVIKNR